MFLGYIKRRNKKKMRKEFKVPMSFAEDNRKELVQGERRTAPSVACRDPEIFKEAILSLVQWPPHATHTHTHTGIKKSDKDSIDFSYPFIQKIFYKTREERKIIIVVFFIFYLYFIFFCYYFQLFLLSFSMQNGNSISLMMFI